MSELNDALRKWAERRMNGDDSDGHSLTLLAHAIRLAPASQERDEDGPRNEHAICPECEASCVVGVGDTNGVCHTCGARLRSGSEPGEPNPPVGLTMDPNAPPLGLTVKPAARPSGGEGVKWEEHGAANPNPERWEGYKGVGGEGAPEPDGWMDEVREFIDDHESSLDRGAMNALWDFIVKRLPPEREACSTCTEGSLPYFCRECVHRREEGLRGALEAEAREPDAWIPAGDHDRWMEGRVSFLGTVLCGTPRDDEQYISVFFGTPGPDREAEIRALKRQRDEALRLLRDEDEIRADERRKVLERVRTELLSGRWVSQGATSVPVTLVLRILARLSPTDEQESPTGDDDG